MQLFRNCKIINIILLVYFFIIQSSSVFGNETDNRKYHSCGLVSEDNQIEWERRLHYNNESYELLIEVSNRASHRIISHIISILLKEKLHYKSVKFVEAPWDSPQQVVKRLSCNTGICKKIPEAFINAEVWMPPGFNVESVAAPGSVIDCGPLGPVTELGLFTPKLLVEKIMSEKGIALDHFRTLQNSSLFKNLKSQKRNENKIWLTNSTMCSNSNECFNVYTDREEFLQPLYNLLQHVFPKGHYNIHLGDQIMLDELSRDNHLGVADYIVDWYPSTRTVQDNFTRLLLPDTYKSMDDNDEFNAGVGHFTSHQPSKVIWSGLESHAELVYNLIFKMKLSQTEYKYLQKRVDKKSLDKEQDYHAIACQWLKDNREKWKSWVEGGDNKINLTIGVLLPNPNHTNCNIPPQLLDGVTAAIHDVNIRFFQSTQYNMALAIQFNECNGDNALENYIALTKSCKQNTLLIGIIAALNSTSLEATVKLANRQRRLIISPTVNCADYLSTGGYPYFFLTMPSLRYFGCLLADILHLFNWKRIIVFRNDDHFVDLQSLKSNDIDILADNKMKEDDLTNEKAYKLLFDARNKLKARIFVVEYQREGALKLICAAGKLGMTFTNSYVWLFGSQLPRMDSYAWDCPEVDYQKTIDGYFSFKIYSQDSSRSDRIDFQKGNPPSEANQSSNSTMKYSSYIYDAAYVLGKSASKLIETYPSAISTLDTDSVAEYLRQTVSEAKWNKSFGHGTAGSQTLKFDKDNEISSNLWILGHYDEFMFRAVYSWSHEQNPKTKNEVRCGSNDSTLLYRNELSEIRWDEIPTDGREFFNSSQSYDCIFGNVEQHLNMSCFSTTLLLCIVSIIVVCIIIVFFVLYYRKKVQLATFPYKKPYDELCKELSMNDILPNNLVINRRIGQGAFAEVFGGEYKTREGWKNIAAKKILHDSSYMVKVDFLQEAKMMLQLQHPSVVKLFGISLHTNDGIFLVMEFMMHGDLKTFLLSRRNNTRGAEVSPQNLTKFMTNVAEGLAYLHSQNYVHRDVACRNCLVTEENNIYFVKLGDFGLTRRLQFNHNDRYYQFRRKSQLPIRWMSPQDLNVGRYNVQSDIWSFGVLLFEVITFGAFPYEDYPDQIVREKVKRYELSIIDCLPTEAKNSDVYQLMSLCCHFNPSERLHNMEEVLHHLRMNPCLVAPYLFENPSRQKFADKTDNITFNNDSLSTSDLIDLMTGSHREILEVNETQNVPLLLNKMSLNGSSQGWFDNTELNLDNSCDLSLKYGSSNYLSDSLIPPDQSNESVEVPLSHFNYSTDAIEEGNSLYTNSLPLDELPQRRLYNYFNQNIAQHPQQVIANRYSM